MHHPLGKFEGKNILFTHKLKRAKKLENNSLEKYHKKNIKLDNLETNTQTVLFNCK